MNYDSILRKHADKFMYSYKSDESYIVEAGQNFTLNLIDILAISKRKSGQHRGQISDESFTGLDFRKCAGKGYYLTNTNFDSCFINCGFLSQKVTIMGAHDLKFIPFGGKNDKYIASISKYGYFTISDFETGVVMLSRELNGYHNEDIIYTTVYEEYILVSLFGMDKANDIHTNVIFVFEKNTFNFILELDGSTLPVKIWKQLNRYYPLRKQPRYIGSKSFSIDDSYKETDKDTTQNKKEVEYTISFDTNLFGIKDDFINKKFKVLNSINHIQNSHQNNEICVDNMFCFYSDDYKLFVGYGNLELAIELSFDDSVNVRLLKKLLFTEDKKRMVAYQTNKPWIYVWDLLSGTFFKIKVSENEVYAAACSSDSKHVVICGDDKKIKMFDLQYGKEINVMGDNVQMSTGCLLSDSRFATGLENGFIKIWDTRDINSQRLCSIFYAHDTEIKGILPINDFTYITYADETTIKLWSYDIASNHSIFNEIKKLIGHKTKVRFVSVNPKYILSASWSEIIRWDIDTQKILEIIPLNSVLTEDVNESEKFHFGNGLGINTNGTLFAYTMTSRNNNYSQECKIVLFNIENKRTIHEIKTELCPDSLAFSPCGNFLAFENGDKCYVYDISSAKHKEVQCLQAFMDLSVLKEPYYYNIVEKALFQSITFLKYIDDGKILVLATREGVIFFYSSNNYELIDIKCMRDNLKFIERYNNRNTIIASALQSLYLWNQTNNTITFLPNINSGYVGCKISNLVTEDISSGFLHILEINGCDVDNISKVNSENIPFIDFNYLVSNAYCDYGDSLNVFTQSDRIDVRQCEIALEYLMCLYKTPAAHQTILPLLVIDMLSRLKLKKEKAGIEIDYSKHLNDVYDVFFLYPKVKSVISNVSTAIIMVKNILWAAEVCDADVTYNMVYKKYLKPVTDIIPDGSENIHTLVHAALIIAEKQIDNERIDDIKSYLANVYKMKNFHTAVPFAYMKTLFHLIKNQPQEHRFNTLDEMYRVYYDNKIIEEVYAYLFARACDHFGREYMNDYYAEYYTEIIVSDLRNVLKYYPNNVDILFTLATYLVVLNGQRDNMKNLKTPFRVFKKKFNFFFFKKHKNLTEKSVDIIIDAHPQLWEIKRTVLRMKKVFERLPIQDQNKESLNLKLQKITQLLTYYNYLD